MSVVCRTISDPTKALIESLYRSVSFWSRQTKHIEALTSIAASCEPAAVREIVPLLLDRDREVRQATADAIGTLASLLKADDYFWLDEGMRRGTYSQSSIAWNQMSSEQLELFGSLNRNTCFALGVATSHWSGFVRQRAVRLLGEVTIGAELPFLLVRLKDWVYDVRLSAAELVRDRLNPGYAAEFAKNLPILMRLKTSTRGKDLEILTDIEKFLKGPSGQAALTEGLQSPDRNIRRYSFTLAWSSDAPNVDAIRQLALADHDPVIRDLGARTLALIADDAVAGEALARAREDRFVSVRRTAVQISFERCPKESRGWLESALLDSHPAIRGLAQFHSEREHGMVSRDFYLHALSLSDLNIKDMYAAISGLGDVGKGEDYTRVLLYTSHDAPRIRRAVMRTLAKLKPDRVVDALLAGLADPSGRVSRESLRGLSKVPNLVTGALAWNLVTDSRFPHVRFNALALISRLTKWESIGYLLEAQCGGDQNLKVWSRTYIRQWQWDFNRTFTTPTDAQKARIERALARCDTSLAASFNTYL